MLPVTKREADVLAGIVEGMSNAQIAGALSISVRTVVKHLEHIYSKLQVHSRAAASYEAHRALQPRAGSAEVGKGRPRERVQISTQAIAAVLPVTPREAEVLARAVQGMSNAQVGRALAISTRTVNKHMQHIYMRMGEPTRAAAIARTIRSLAERQRG